MVSHQLYFSRIGIGMRMGIRMWEPRTSNKLPTSTLLDHLLRARRIAVKHPINIKLEHAPDIFFPEIKRAFTCAMLAFAIMTFSGPRC